MNKKVNEEFFTMKKIIFLFIGLLSLGMVNAQTLSVTNVTAETTVHFAETNNFNIGKGNK